MTRPQTPVLDVGCGRADKAVLFPLGTYVGIDPIDPIAAGMVERLDAPVVCGLGERLPFAGAQFSSVLLFGVVDHVADRQGLYGECARVLRPGGSLCVLNQVPGEHDRSPAAILRWALSRIRSGDVAGIAAVARFTLANPAARRFVHALSATEIVDELGAHFSATEHRLVEDGHVLLARSVR